VIKSVNIGFGDPISPDDLAQLRSMRLQGVRTEIPVHASLPQIDGILEPLVGSGLQPLILLHGEALPALALCMQALDVALAAHKLGLAIDLEAANEPNINDCDPLDMSAKLLAVHDALGTMGFTGKLYGGSVSNLHRDGLEYLRAMQWEALPSDLLVAVHRYAPRNEPGSSHLDSLKAEIDAVSFVTGRTARPAMTEAGYHTALNTSEWSWKPPYFHPAHRLTNEQAAEAIFNDLHAYAGWGVPRVDLFQWNCGIPDDEFDYEALYGVRDPQGVWLPQGQMLAQIGDL
jgi:hypothetical protein